MQYELTSTQEIKSTIYMIQSEYTDLFYRVQVNYLKDTIEGWLCLADEGNANFIVGFLNSEVSNKDAVEIILNEAQNMIANKETGTNYL